MQKIARKRTLAAAVLAVLLACFLLFAGCSVVQSGRSITGIARAGTDIVVTYSDGTTETIDTVSMTDVSAKELYEYYTELYPEENLTYKEFLAEYLSAEADNSSVIGEALLSSVKLYTEFRETVTTSSGWLGRPQQVEQAAVYTGSGVIYKTDGEYTYIITNYHVVYSASANEDNAEDNPGGRYIARKIMCYLYGSEDSPDQSGTSDGYPAYEYGPYAVECEYVGGALTKDIALVRAKTADMTAVRSDLRAVTFADGYHVGETAIAIGNAEDEGISVTEGIVSVASEDINLKIDGTSRSYRSLRIDTAIYGGNSGGGLFNVEGELIGITNAGDEQDQNINFAIPVEIVQGVADNIYYYATDGDDSTNGAYAPTLKVTVTSRNSRYVYDVKEGYGEIVEDIVVRSVESGSISERAGLQADDILTSMTIDGIEYELDRSYDIADALLNVRPNSQVTITYTRNGESATSGAVTVTSSDFTQIS